MLLTSEIPLYLYGLAAVPGEARLLTSESPCSFQFKNNYFTEMCSVSEAGSYLRLIDFCINQFWA